MASIPPTNAPQVPFVDNAPPPASASAALNVFSSPISRVSFTAAKTHCRQLPNFASYSKASLYYACSANSSLLMYLLLYFSFKSMSLKVWVCRGLSTSWGEN